MNRPLAVGFALSAGLVAVPAFACDFSLMETPAVKWETCNNTRYGTRGEETYGEGFKVTIDQESFDKYYAKIQKTTEVGDLNRDTHDPDSYCGEGLSWLGVGGTDRSYGDWITTIITGSGNADDDVKFLCKKAHEEFITRVRGITCRMNTTGKQPELKLEGTTLVVEVVPYKCTKLHGCDEYQGRQPTLGDFHSYVYWDWMGRFFAKNFPAFKKAATVAKRKYPSVPLPDVN
jgi:hypothetical protein